MEKRICPICGDAFNVVKYNQRFCSPECAYEKKKEWQRTYQREYAGCVERKQKINEKRVCPVCGNSFIPSRTTQKYCSRTCNIKNFSNSKRKNRKVSSKPKMNIAEVQMEAKKAGMSYGQYVAYLDRMADRRHR